MTDDFRSQVKLALAVNEALTTPGILRGAWYDAGGIYIYTTMMNLPSFKRFQFFGEANGIWEFVVQSFTAEAYRQRYTSACMTLIDLKEFGYDFSGGMEGMEDDE